MPYIKSDDRMRFDSTLNEVEENPPRSCGELNYLFTMIALEFIKAEGENYQHYNDIIGALENCKLELYRRKIGNYEEQAIKRNGDIN